MAFLCSGSQELTSVSCSWVAWAFQQKIKDRCSEVKFKTGTNKIATGRDFFFFNFDSGPRSVS